MLEARTQTDLHQKCTGHDEHVCCKAQGIAECRYKQVGRGRDGTCGCRAQ